MLMRVPLHVLACYATVFLQKPRTSKADLTTDLSLFQRLSGAIVFAQVQYKKLTP